MISIDIFDTALFADSYDFFNQRRSEHDLLEHCTCNEAVLNVYKLYKGKFILLSDDGYSSEFLKKLLYNCGYDHPLVFTPSCTGVKKEDGSFFKEVEEKINEKITMHYGDNYKEDIEGALKAGIKAVFNGAPSKFKVTLPNVKDKKLRQYLLKTIIYDFEEEQDLKAVKIFAAFMAPILTSFANWVMNEGVCPIFISKSLFPVYSIIKEVLGYEAFYTGLDNNEDSCLLIDKEGIIVSFNQVNVPERKTISFRDDFLKEFGHSLKIIKFFLESDNPTKVPMHTRKSIVEGETIKKTYYFNVLYKQLLEKCEQVKYMNYEKEDILSILNFVRSNKLFYSMYNDPNLIEENGIYRSCLNYNRELIKEGYLRSLYESSYDKELFKQILGEDSEYGHLIELL